MDNPKKVLDGLTDELLNLVGSEDLTDQDLREASEGLLPSLCDALQENGFGIRRFKIWSNEHNGWWKPRRMGYTNIRSEAGVYTLEEATDICEKANIGLHDIPNETMVELAADESAMI